VGGGVLPGGEPADHRQAAWPGQLVRHNEEVVRPGRRPRQTGRAVGRQVHQIADLLQGPLHQPRLAGVLFHDQEMDRGPRRHVSSVPSGLWPPATNRPRGRSAAVTRSSAPGGVRAGQRPQD
jgi:hypothetical protein